MSGRVPASTLFSAAITSQMDCFKPDAVIVSSLGLSKPQRRPQVDVVRQSSVGRLEPTPVANAFLVNIYLPFSVEESLSTCCFIVRRSTC